MRMSPKDIARSNGGFTLVESVVVMVVLAIVLAVKGAKTLVRLHKEKKAPAAQ